MVRGWRGESEREREREREREKERGVERMRGAALQELPRIGGSVTAAGEQRRRIGTRRCASGDERACSWQTYARSWEFDPISDNFLTTVGLAAAWLAEPGGGKPTSKQPGCSGRASHISKLAGERNAGAWACLSTGGVIDRIHLLVGHLGRGDNFKRHLGVCGVVAVAG